MKEILDSYFKNDDLVVKYYETIDSTNDEAKRLFYGGDSNKYLLVASNQTKGRGRNGHSFYSPSDAGIYFSFLIPTTKEIKDIVYMTTSAAVAVAMALRDVLLVDAGIKWINDIYISGKKACGILCEVADKGEGVHGLIIGIGINMGQADFPEEIKDIAISVGDIDKEKKAELLHAISDNISKYLDAGNKPKMMEDYRKLSLVIGKEIAYIINGERYTGIAVAIDDEGGLIVDNNGEKTVLNSGEISVRLI